MSRKRLLQMVILSIKKLQDPYYHGFAAQLAFYFLLSIVPTIIVLSQILGMFSISLTALGQVIAQYMAEDVAKVVIKLLSYKSNHAMDIVFIVITFWAASKAEFALMRIANYTMTGGKSTGSNYFKERIRALKTMVLTLFTMVFSLIILVYGELILDLVATAFTEILKKEYEFSRFWLIIRWPVGIVLYFFMVSYNYHILPSERQNFMEVLPGSFFAAIGMLIVTTGYKYYAEYITDLNIIYGYLATVVAVMMWFYFLAWDFVLGFMVNKVWQETAIAEDKT